MGKADAANSQEGAISFLEDESGEEGVGAAAAAAGDDTDNADNDGGDAGSGAEGSGDDSSNADSLSEAEQAQLAKLRGEGAGKKVKPAKKKGGASGDPKTDPSRMEYWQSQADKANARAQALEFAAPLAQLLMQKPELVPELQKLVAGSAAPAEVKLERPKAPQAPAAYDEVAAVNDPTSESFKYRIARQGYVEQLADYMEKKESVMDRKFQEAEARSQAAEKQREAVLQLRGKLQEHGVVGEQADEFIRTFSDPKSITFDNLVELFRINKGISKAGGAAKAKAEALLARQQRSNVPLPLGAAGGGEGGSGKITDEEAFNLSLYGSGKKKGKI